MKLLRKFKKKNFFFFWGGEGGGVWGRWVMWGMGDVNQE